LFLFSFNTSLDNRISSTKEKTKMRTKKNPDGSITFIYESLAELSDAMERLSENPTNVDADLASKDRADERIWGY